MKLVWVLLTLVGCCTSLQLPGPEVVLTGVCISNYKPEEMQTPIDGYTMYDVSFQQCFDKPIIHNEVLDT